VGRLASEEIVLSLGRAKCLPKLWHATQVCVRYLLVSSTAVVKGFQLQTSDPIAAGHSYRKIAIEVYEI
jgi:hypothetical protein